MNPSWYGLRYPSLEDLEKAAEDLGCRVGYADIGEDAIYIAPDADYGEPPVILIPTGIGLLRQAWLMAHELAHLVMHSGPKSKLTYRRDETRADLWAACALIPEARIQDYQNACQDVFIGALSAHYEDIPLEICELRDLAADIATIRLRALKEVA